VVEWDVLEHFDDEFGWGEYFSGCFDSLLAAVGVAATVVHLGGDSVPHVHGVLGVLSVTRTTRLGYLCPE
jgi:hypothetical protein